MASQNSQTTTTITTSISNMARSNAQQQQQQQQQTGANNGPQCQNNVEPLDKSTSNTLKRNPKMELSKTDLLKLLSRLEGELQARDIVIAALKSEKLKYLLSSRYLSGTSDPHAALARDVVIAGGVIGYETSHIDQQVASLEALVTQQRRTQSRMTKVLKDAELRHRAVIKELEEEKRKHEHDTAQGDDITYGLEKERTRLKKELELEKQEKKRLELELKKSADSVEEEKARQKQIVLLLLAERKKIIMKYIEERKRSEDLAQILSEEKVRIDSMAEGLEEESKKSLQMEAELEKQLAQFDIERQQYRQALAKEEKRAKELEAELEKARTELEAWKESSGGRRLGSTPPPPPAKPANLVPMPASVRPATAPQTIKGAVLGTGTPMVSSKVVQPTATVSSVPVSGPTIGIARSVTPGQTIRGVGYPTVGPVLPTQAQELPTAAAATAAAVPPPTAETQKEPPQEKQRVQGPPTTGKLAPAVQPSTGKLSSFHVPATGTIQPAGLLQKKPISRGVPPPVPPNKPVVPPKKEAAYLRRPADLAQTQDPGQKEAQKPKQPTGQPSGPQVQQTIAAFNQPSDEEAKPR